MDKNNVDTAKELPTVISFCSGYGGIERGLDLAGVEHRVLAYVEIEAYATDSGQGVGNTFVTIADKLA